MNKVASLISSALISFVIVSSCSLILVGACSRIRPVETESSCGRPVETEYICEAYVGDVECPGVTCIQCTDGIILADELHCMNMGPSEDGMIMWSCGHGC